MWKPHVRRADYYPASFTAVETDEVLEQNLCLSLRGSGDFIMCVLDLEMMMMKHFGRTPGKDHFLFS